jgi:hypothetical protein
MKTLYKILIIITLFITSNPFGLFSQSYSSTTIYTPKGTSVSALILTSGDYPPATKDYLRDYWLDFYDNRITYLGEATYSYNCHAYAWHISEGGNTVWINTPGDDTYWQDWSYLEVPSQSLATKVSFGSTDHSAITTGTQDYFISKWGASPRFRHHKDDCPYNSQDLHYYIRTYITGPTMVCSSPNSTFVLNGRPGGSTVTWTKSNNLTYVSGQGTNNYVVHASSSGSGWVAATVYNGGDSYSVPQYAFWVGGPIITDQRVDGNAYQYGMGVSPGVGHWLTFVPYPDNGSITDSWTVPSGIQYTIDQGNHRLGFYFLNNPSLTFTVQAANTCGTGPSSSYYLTMQRGYGMTLSPNPASETVTVTRKASGTTEDIAIADIFEDATTIYTIRIIDFYGSLHYTATKSGESFTFPVSSLKDGQYIVQITDGKNTTSLPLIVKH